MSRRVRRSMKLIPFALFVSLAVAAIAQGLPPGAVPFPGSPWARCPGGARYEIVYRELYPSPRGNHELMLRDRKSGTERSVLIFDRHAAVMWAPGCAAFAVTDWGASDFSRVVLYTVSAPEPVADIQAVILNQLGRLPSIFGNHHVYLEAVGWPTSNFVRIKASGYGDVDPNGFEVFYEYELGGPIRKVPAPKE